MRLTAFVIICFIATSWLVEGQFPNNNNNNNNNFSNDPELFLAIVVVIVVIAIVLVGAIASLVIICFVYYCCTPIPIPPELPPRAQVRANPNTQTPQTPTSPYMTETLPPVYDEHEQYPRGTLSQRSRNSLPRYSLIFKKNRNRSATSERSMGSIDPAVMSIPDNIELPEDRGDDAI